MDSRLLSRRASALVLSTLVLFALPSLAAAPAWTSAGAPTGGNVYKVVVDPTDSSNIYALSDPGVYQSSDGGATWTLVLSDPSHILDLAMAPSDHLTLYATTFNKTVYKTTDGGATWPTVTDPVSTASQTEIFRVTVDPNDADTVYVLTDNSGVRKSTDGGSHWSAKNTGLSSVVSAVANAVNDNVLNRLVVDPTDTQVLYLAVSQSAGGSNPDGLFKSTDGGGHWSVLAGISGVSLTDVDMDPNDHTHLAAVGCVAGFYDVTNSGANATNSSGPCLQRVKFDPANSLHLYAGTSSAGLSQSPDSGASWSSSSDLTAAQVYDVAVDPHSTNVFVGTAALGLYLSSDSGTSWALSNTGIDDVMVNAMVTGNDAMYVASGGSGVLKSVDGGTTWNTANSGLNDLNVYGLVQDPKTPATLYAATQTGLFQTQDSGGSWALLNNGITDHVTLAVAVDPQVPATVYAGTMHKLFKSTDGGAHWSPTGAGLPSNFPDIVSIAVDPTDSDIVFAGSDTYGLYESSDGGAHFNPAGASLASATWITAIAFDPADPKTVYVATINNIGFFKSVDGGTNWTESDNGFPSILDYSGFAQIIVDPADPATLFVMPYLPGDTAVGTYYSTDAGADWSPLSIGSVGAARATESTSKAAVTMSWVAVNPKKPSQLTAMGSDHKLYLLSSIADLHSSGSSSGGSGGGGGGGGGGTAASGGGGGTFPLFTLVLLGFAALRRRY